MKIAFQWGYKSEKGENSLALVLSDSTMDLRNILLINIILSAATGIEHWEHSNLKAVDIFLSSFQNVAHSVLFLCNFKEGEFSLKVLLTITKYSLTFTYFWIEPCLVDPLAKMMSDRGILFNIASHTSATEITKILPRNSYPKCGLIIDMKCLGATTTLREVCVITLSASKWVILTFVLHSVVAIQILQHNVSDALTEFGRPRKFSWRCP